MILRTASISRMALLLAGAASMAWSAETGDDKPNDSKIWNGVFTAAQVERGKADFEKSCSNCHVSDLSGSVRAPALRGQRFMQNWQNGSVGVLFTKIRDSMPANYPETVPEEIKLDILTFLLNQNGFPAGAAELKLDDKELADIQIVQKGNQAVANFAMVRIVGCLARGPGKTWTLTKSTEPAVVKEETATPAALKTAADSPLGTQIFELVSAMAFKPESRQGQRVEARGLLYRESSHNLLNLTSLEPAGSGCN
jgi:mono/diheme cytochrome c family protein